MADVGPRGDPSRRSRNRDRGVSTVVGYVLNIGIATLLITGLILAGGNLVSDQRDRAIRSEFGVIGHRVAANLETADRLVRASDGGSVSLEAELPTHISGQQYQISIEPDADEEVDVVLTMDQPDITVSVHVNNTTAIEPTTVTGGGLNISATGDGPVEVHDG